MAKIHFRKELVKNKLMFKDGTYATFEPLAEGYGVAALDSEADKDKILQLRAWIARKTGGVSEITEAAYEETKKKFDSTAWQHSRFAQLASRGAPRIYNPEAVTPIPTAPAASVPAVASAKPAEAPAPVPPVAAKDESLPAELPKPMGRKIKLNIGRPKIAPEQPGSEQAAQ